MTAIVLYEVRENRLSPAYVSGQNAQLFCSIEIAGRRGTFRSGCSDAPAGTQWRTAGRCRVGRDETSKRKRGLRRPGHRQHGGPPSRAVTCVPPVWCIPVKRRTPLRPTLWLRRKSSACKTVSVSRGRLRAQVQGSVVLSDWKSHRQRSYRGYRLHPQCAVAGGAGHAPARRVSTRPARSVPPHSSAAPSQPPIRGRSRVARGTFQGELVRPADRARCL